MRLLISFFLVLLTLNGPASAQTSDSPKRVLFFGDSITAGYGVGKEQAYPALIQQKIDSLGWNFTVANGGLSGETSAGGLRRIDWMMRQPLSVFVLELGGNDGLRGINLSSTKKNLQAIIDKVEKKYPQAKIIIAGMQVPPNLGTDYTDEFKKMYPDLADRNDVTLIPFLLKDVGGIPELNQGDGIHPNSRGHKIVAQNVWEVLKPVLQDLRQ